jgi:hypothetical protein
VASVRRRSRTPRSARATPPRPVSAAAGTAYRRGGLIVLVAILLAGVVALNVVLR